MATHSSILDWEIPWTEEPGGLQSMGSDTIKWLSAATAGAGIRAHVFRLLGWHFLHPAPQFPAVRSKQYTHLGMQTHRQTTCTCTCAHTHNVLSLFFFLKTSNSDAYQYVKCKFRVMSHLCSALLRSSKGLGILDNLMFKMRTQDHQTDYARHL